MEVRFESLSVRKGPDLFVAGSRRILGRRDRVRRLKATDGSFNMDLPVGAVSTDAASVVIWCKQFAVQFALAALED
ncbi:MAG: DM13 domain-containing protein [Chloroflexota bacterium]